MALDSTITAIGTIFTDAEQKTLSKAADILRIPLQALTELQHGSLHDAIIPSQPPQTYGSPIPILDGHSIPPNDPTTQFFSYDPYGASLTTTLDQDSQSLLSSPDSHGFSPLPAADNPNLYNHNLVPGLDLGCPAVTHTGQPYQQPNDFWAPLPSFSPFVFPCDSLTNYAYYGSFNPVPNLAGNFDDPIMSMTSLQDTFVPSELPANPSQPTERSDNPIQPSRQPRRKPKPPRQDKETLKESKPKSKRRHLTDPERGQTAWTRNLRGCIRCRMNRVRCFPDLSDPTGPCLTCKNSTFNIFRLPCLRYKIVDSTLYRVGDHTQHPKDLYSGPKYGGFTIKRIWTEFFIPMNWKGAEVRTLDLTQDRGTVLHFKVRQYVPPVNDHRRDSRGRSFHAVPWALTNARDAMASMDAFIDESVDVYIEYYRGDMDEITRMVIDAARQCASSDGKNSDLFKDLLRFWTAARFIEGGWRCCGSEMLGADKLPNPYDPPCITPPPYIDHQMAAFIMECVLEPLRRKILKSLQGLVLASNTPKNWFHIFLLTFVLLNGFELVFAHEVAWTRKRKYPVRYADMGRVRALHSGAKVLLAHFHYVCKGSVPFRRDFDWTCLSNRSMAALDAEQLCFVRSLTDKIEDKLQEVQVAKVSDRHEKRLWFTGQMFDADWKPKETCEHAPPMGANEFLPL